MSRARLCFSLLLASTLLHLLIFGSDSDGVQTASRMGFRGHVKQCTEQDTYPAQGEVATRTYTSEWTFTPDGRVLQSRTGQGSQLESVTTYTYDPAGHPLSSFTSNPGQSAAPQLGARYTYDDDGRLKSIADTTGKYETTYDYTNGQKRRTQPFPVMKSEPNVAVGTMQWEDSDLHIPPPSGGTITTIYDDHDHPLEADIRDAGGTITMRLVRTYDEKGHILTDKLTAENMQSSVPDELSAQLNDAQKQAIAKFIGSAFANQEASYKYDSEGRVIEKRITGGAFGDELTTIHYNDHGDIANEQTTTTPTPESSTEYGMDEAGHMSPVGKSKPPEPSQTEVRYQYEYDSHGNWTQKATSHRSAPNGDFQTTVIAHRTLTYW